MRVYWRGEEKKKMLLEALKSKAFIYIPSLEKNILELMEKNKLPESFEKDLREILIKSKKMVIFSLSHDGQEMVRFFSIRQYEKGYNEIFGLDNHLKIKITEFD